MLTTTVAVRQPDDCCTGDADAPRLVRTDIGAVRLEGQVRADVSGVPGQVRRRPVLAVEAAGSSQLGAHQVRRVPGPLCRVHTEMCRLVCGGG